RESTKKVLIIAEYVVAKTGVAMIIIEDKHSKNIKSASCLGEAKFLLKNLLWKMKIRGEITIENLFAIRIISTYVDSTMTKENGLNTGLDLAEPDGKRAVLMSLARIQQLRLKPTCSST
ncbi:16925_t:CDS:2, partial [Funneliformis mosseae]